MKSKILRKYVAPGLIYRDVALKSVLCASGETYNVPTGIIIGQYDNTQIENSVTNQRLVVQDRLKRL